MIFLYIKTHNITGLKYLGKTIRDPYKYKGSGTIWLRHLAKHGEDVSTEVIYQTKNKKEFKAKALYFSELYNIVESSEWANLTHEEGQGGYTRYPKNRCSHCKGGPKKGHKFTETHNNNLSDALKKYWSNKTRVAWNKGMPMAEEQKQKLRKPKTEAHKQAISNAKRGKIRKSNE